MAPPSTSVEFRLLHKVNTEYLICACGVFVGVCIESEQGKETWNMVYFLL